jgi:hypothetical protein
MESLRAIFSAAFSLDNIWWLVIKASIWFIIAIIIMVKTDSPDAEKSLKDLKSTLGFFLMFTMLTGGLLYLLFGQVPA